MTSEAQAGAGFANLEADRDTVFRLLSNPRRRRLVSLLADASGPMSLERLASELAARERDADTDPGPDAVTNVRAALYHVHVPELTAAGVVEYDEDDGVALTGDGAELAADVAGAE